MTGEIAIWVAAAGAAGSTAAAITAVISERLAARRADELQESNAAADSYPEHVVAHDHESSLLVLPGRGTTASPTRREPDPDPQVGRSLPAHPERVRSATRDLGDTAVTHEVIESALLRSQMRSLRADAETRVSGLFQDAEQLATLAAPEWQVIFGRRGSGKTSLMRAADEHMGSRGRHLPVFLPARHVADASDADVEVAVASFLEMLLDALVRAVDATPDRPRFLGLRRSPNRSGSMIVAELHDALVGFQSAEKLEQHRPSLGSEPAARLRTGIEALAQLLDVDRVVLLIDDWSVLGKPTQIQLAEILRRAFLGSSIISVKFAAVRERAWFSEPGRGLVLGADIHVAVDLDQPLWTPEDRAEFLARVLGARLSAADHRVGRLFFEAPSAQAGLAHIFASDEAFEELVKGTSTTRDFLFLFRTLAQSHAWRVEPRWTAHDVRLALRDHRLVASALENEVGLFAVPSKAAEKVRESARRLVAADLVSQVPRENLPIEVRDRFDVYRLNAGVSYDWWKTEASPSETRPSAELVEASSVG